MYRNALNKVGGRIELLEGISKTYIQQRDFKDEYDIRQSLGVFQNNSDVLAVVKTTGIETLNKSENTTLFNYTMGITIELFCPTDAEKDYNKSSEAAFDVACLNILREFSSEQGSYEKQYDNADTVLFISEVKACTAKEMLPLEEAKKNMHHITFTVHATETIND